jgi:hypothetical protein
MRELKYISPTSLQTFQRDRSEFYLNYLAEHRPARMPQTQPMSVGSAFDAFVKSHIMKLLHGAAPPEFEMEVLFNQQVEPHNREWARKHGANVFRQYIASGALADLMSDLATAAESPRFEVKVEARIPHEDVIEGIPLLGKPDLYFITKEGAHVVYDWKVNGYCAKRPTSPKKGFIMVRDGWKEDYARSRVVNCMHKDAQLMRINGITINIADWLENIYTPWANQLSIYAWVLGEPVGSGFVVGIDQLVGIPRPNANPSIRVAAHRMRVSANHQHALIRDLAVMWNTVREGPRALFIEDGMTPDESEARCEILDKMHEVYAPSEDPKDQWFTDNLRGDSKMF